MKTIRVLIPTYNEEENVEKLAEAIIRHFETELPEYDYFINFIDNMSSDGTRRIIREMCAKNKKITAIFNAKNFGQFNSPYYGLITNDIGVKSDCTVLMSADFQDPVEMIKKFVVKWEEGFQVVAGIKSKSKTSKIMHFLRSTYYKYIKKISAVDQIEHFTGFGLYDNRFIDVLKNLKDPTPFLRGVVAEFCGSLAKVEYTQAKRQGGKTSNNFKTLYDAAMLSVTTYTKRIPRYATLLGALLSGFTFFSTVALGILKIFFPVIDAMYILFSGLAFVGFINLFFIGMVGEYVINMNVRQLNRPLVIEQERINFEDKNDKEII